MYLPFNLIVRYKRFLYLNNWTFRYHLLIHSTRKVFPQYVDSAVGFDVVLFQGDTGDTICLYLEVQPDIQVLVSHKLSPPRPDSNTPIYL